MKLPKIGTILTSIDDQTVSAMVTAIDGDEVYLANPKIGWQDSKQIARYWIVEGKDDKPAHA